MMHTGQYERVFRESRMEEMGRLEIDFLYFYFPPLRAIRAVAPLCSKNTQQG